MKKSNEDKVIKAMETIGNAMELIKKAGEDEARYLKKESDDIAKMLQAQGCLMGAITLLSNINFEHD